MWFVLALGMTGQALGEMMGYAFGRSGAAERRYDTFEIEQMQFA